MVGWRLERQVCSWLNLQNGAPEVGLNARQRLSIIGLEAQHDDRRRVGRPRQPETVGILDSYAVDRDHLLRAFEVRLRTQPLDQLEVLGFPVFI